MVYKKFNIFVYNDDDMYCIFVLVCKIVILIWLNK